MTNRIAQLRKARKISQAELADGVDVTRQTIISLESGRYNASLLRAHKIARYFGLTIEDVFLFEEDAEKIKTALQTLFENDCSAARPEGSMEVLKVYWWKHNCKIGQYPSAKVHRSLKISVHGEGKSLTEYKIEDEHLAGLEPEVYDGLQ